MEGLDPFFDPFSLVRPSAFSLECSISLKPKELVVEFPTEIPDRIRYPIFGSLTNVTESLGNIERIRKDSSAMTTNINITKKPVFMYLMQILGFYYLIIIGLEMYVPALPWLKCNIAIACLYYPHKSIK
jgi:hypothetical protein